MTNLFKTSIALVMSLCFIGCKNNSKNTQETESSKTDLLTVEGNYVSADYEKKNEGYDWVAVIVNKSSDSTITVSVRSRSDIKKPTCTFDNTAYKLNDSTYTTTTDGKVIHYVFAKNSITIGTEKQEDSALLNYYCSGGGSLAGTYTKISVPLDEKQIDQRVFAEVLTMQNIGFSVETTGKGSIQQLSVQPFGLKTDNSIVKMEIEGRVTNAEVGDLNCDGFPELLIYTSSAGSGSYGNVIGFSVNNGKSMSQIYFPNITDNPKANKGFMGHDEFAIVETTLVQRFKTYNNNDQNAKPTGVMRQIQYKLKDGEASRKFVIDKIIEF